MLFAGKKQTNIKFVVRESAESVVNVKVLIKTAADGYFQYVCTENISEKTRQCYADNPHEMPSLILFKNKLKKKKKKIECHRKMFAQRYLG